MMAEPRVEWIEVRYRNPDFAMQALRKLEECMSQFTVLDIQWVRCRKLFMPIPYEPGVKAYWYWSLDVYFLVL